MRYKFQPATLQKVFMYLFVFFLKMIQAFQEIQKRRIVKPRQYDMRM